MQSYEFACPYCSGEFALDERPAGEAVACPHCGGAVALPADLDAPGGQTTLPPDHPSAADNFAVDRSDPAAELPSALDFLEQPTASPKNRPARPRPRQTAPPTARRLSREEQNRRRLRRNLVMMTVGMIVLAIAVAVLLRV